MKKLPKLLIAITSFTLITFACKKNEDSKLGIDSTNPVITLKGDADLTVALSSNTPDPGANAIDETDGDISASVTSNWNTAVDQNKTGSYTVNYSVSDKAGNKANATRKVTVKSMGANLLGEYTATLAVSVGSSPVPNVTVSIGNNPSQIVFNPVYLAYTLRADLKGPLNEELTFDYEDQAAHFTGTGNITNAGKNITLVGTIVTTGGSQTFTQTMIKN